MKDSVKLENERARKRRVPDRLNSVSYELLYFSKVSTGFSTKSKTNRHHKEELKSDVFLKMKSSQKAEPNINNRKTKTKYRRSCSRKVVEEKKTEMKKIFKLGENSYRNSYFQRCKSYKKMKMTDFNFEFDFSTFDSHAPFYPTALEDINTKINRTNQFLHMIRE